MITITKDARGLLCLEDYGVMPSMPADSKDARIRSMLQSLADDELRRVRKAFVEARLGLEAESSKMTDAKRMTAEGRQLSDDIWYYRDLTRAIECEMQCRLLALDPEDGPVAAEGASTRKSGNAIREAAGVPLAEMVRKEKDGWHVYAADGKKHLGGPYDSEAEAMKRMKQVEHFKDEGMPPKKMPMKKEAMGEQARPRSLGDSLREYGTPEGASKGHATQGHKGEGGGSGDEGGHAKAASMMTSYADEADDPKAKKAFKTAARAMSGGKPGAMDLLNAKRVVDEWEKDAGENAPMFKKVSARLDAMMDAQKASTMKALGASKASAKAQYEKVKGAIAEKPGKA